MNNCNLNGHCYCEDIMVGMKIHHKCCMCGHQTLKSSFVTFTGDPPDILPGATRSTIDNKDNWGDEIRVDLLKNDCEVIYAKI